MTTLKYALYPGYIDLEDDCVYMSALDLAKHHGVSLHECAILTEEYLRTASRREIERKTKGLISLSLPTTFKNT